MKGQVDFSFLKTLFLVFVHIWCYIGLKFAMAPTEHARKKQAEEEEKKLIKQAEEAEAERIRTQSQIWVNE